MGHDRHWRTSCCCSPCGRGGAVRAVRAVRRSAGTVMGYGEFLLPPCSCRILRLRCMPCNSMTASCIAKGKFCFSRHALTLPCQQVFCKRLGTPHPRPPRLAGTRCVAYAGTDHHSLPGASAFVYKIDPMSILGLRRSEWLSNTPPNRFSLPPRPTQTQEIWSLAVPVVWLAFFATDSQLQRVSSPANLALLGAFLVHYIHRDLIYPFRIVPGEWLGRWVWLTWWLWRRGSV